MLYNFNGTYTIQTSAAMRAQWPSMVSGSKIGRLCSGQNVEEHASKNGDSEVGRRATCADDGPALAAVGVRLLVGVLIDPSNCARREAIRRTWMRWAGVGRRSLVCFVFGRKGLPAAMLASLDAEAAAHGDILWLPRTTDGCFLSISKVHDWWRAAAALQDPGEGRRATLTHAAKVDDPARHSFPTAT